MKLIGFILLFIFLFAIVVAGTEETITYIKQRKAFKEAMSKFNKQYPVTE